MIVDIIDEFLKYRDKTFILLENSYLSDEAKARYEKMYGNRLRVVSYKLI